MRRDRTDVRGTFALGDVVSGDYQLRASAPGHVTARRPLKLRRATRLGALLLEREAPLHGFVGDRRGRPIVGARVFVAAQRAGVDGVEARSDAGGFYLVRGLPPGRYNVRAEALGFAPLRRDGLSLPRRRWDLRLEVAHELWGKVLGPGGAGVPRCELIFGAVGSGRQRNARCDDAGRFRVVGLSPGSYEIWARSPSAPWLATPPRVGILVPRAAGERSGLLLRAVTASAVEGTVRSAEKRQPLDGARVTVRPLAPALLSVPTLSDERGRFRTPALPPGRYRISVWRAGRLPVSRRLTLPSRGDVEFLVAPGHRLSGRVVDAKGAAVVNAVVRAIVAGERRQATGKPDRLRTVGELGVMPGPIPPIPPIPAAGAGIAGAAPGGLWSATSDAQGRFELEGIPAGRVRLIAIHPRYQEGLGAWLKVGAARPLGPQVLRLVAAAELTGRVRGPYGAAVAGAWIHVEAADGKGRRGRRATTDRRGTFRFFGIVGKVRVRILASGYAPRERTLELLPGRRLALDVRLGKLGRELRGHVVDADGRDVAGALVQLGAPGVVTARVRSGRGGLFRLSVSGKGPFWLRVDKARRGRLRRTLAEIPYRTLELRLAAEVTLVGRVQDWRTGVALRRFRVRFVEEGEKSKVVLSPQGEFRISATPGKRRLEVTARGYLPRVVAVRVEPKRRAHLQRGVRVELREAGSVAGVVADPLGRVVAGVRVSVLGSAGRATSDKSGRFLLPAVAPGKVRLILRHGASVRRSAPIYVRAGERAELRLEVPR